MVDTESEDAFKQVCEAVRKGEAVLWVGSGFSKYAGYPLGNEFGKELAEELGEPELADTLELPDIAERYKSAKTRTALEEQIDETFGKEPNNPETHRILSLIKRIPFIVTTNYDCLIEDAFGEDIIVIVTEEEMGKTRGQGYGNPKPILYKPHGDVKHLDRVVVTRSDYDGFDNKSLLWSRISALPAEYQIVFIGYSLTDGHAQDLLTRILTRLGPQQKPHIVINKHITADDTTRYSRFELQWIEKDAEEAISEIKDHVTRYSLVDAGTDPARVKSCDPLLQERGISLGTTTQDGEVTNWSFNPIDPAKPIEKRWVLPNPIPIEFPEGSNPSLFISGDVFDPQHATILTNVVEINGILLPRPEPSPIRVTVVRRPDEEFLVDLRTGSNNTIPSVLAKRYLSENRGRVVLSTNQFDLTINIEKSTRQGDFTLKIRPTTNIEVGRRTYSCFDAWVGGDPIQVLPQGTENYWSIPPFIQEDPSMGEMIRFWHQFYQDLSNIQGVYGKPIRVPEEGITEEDCQVIATASKLITEGRKGSGELTLTLRREGLDATKILSHEPVTLRVTNPKMVETFDIFGEKILIPFALEGHGLVPANLEEASAELKSEAETIIVRYDGSVGELFQRYLPPSNQNGDREMTNP
ncbi:MAG: SIR2 family protein [Methanospirillum sp.]